MNSLRDAIIATSRQIGVDPVDLATAMSYETGGTFDPWKAGPTTKWGQHRGLIQWGEPQRQKYGVSKEMPIGQQVAAAGQYLVDAGVRPGMGLLDIYSAINAGGVGRYDASDEAAGGAPGSVRDKVANQMADHRRKAQALIGGGEGFDPFKAGALAFDEPQKAPANNAFDTLLNPGVAVMKGGAAFQMQAPAAPVQNDAFDPFAAGAISLDGGNPQKDSGLTPIVSQTPQMQTPGMDFAAKAAGMDPVSLSVARSKNDAFGLWLREQATQPRDGESDMARAQRLYGSLGPDVEPSRVRSAVMGAVDLPIVGPALTHGVNAAASGLDAATSDRSYSDNMRRAAEIEARDAATYPGARLAGNFAGAVATMAPLGGTSLGARAMGITGNSLLGRMAASAATNAAIAGADTATHGGSLEDVALSAGIGGAVGGVVPAAGALLKAGGNALRDRVAPTVNALVRSPEGEAGRRISAAFARDAQMGGVNQIDDAAVAANGQDVRLVDRGGETVRALTRSSANQSPEARAVVSDLSSTRFESQGDRALGFLYRVSGGATDDLALRDAIQSKAASVNAPAYRAAYEAPEAQAIWTPGLQNLTSAPAMRAAIQGAEARGANRAAVDGFKPVVNPFVRQTDGSLALRVKADGSKAIPNLQFWDQVKRNLDSRIGMAQRAGDNINAADLMKIKTALVNELDSTVPAYQTARRGAAAFFDAEDALDAGKKFALSNKDLRLAVREFAKMSDTEKEAFRVGFAAQLSDAIKATGDRRNVINRVFGSKAARDKIEVALGPQKFREFEAFVHVETAMDSLRTSLGNSTTARQLTELGLAGGAGAGVGFYATGDWRGALAGAVLSSAGRYRESAVAREVAKLLVSTDPQAAVKATQLALRSPQGMGIVKALSKGVESLVKAAPVIASRPQPVN